MQPAGNGEPGGRNGADAVPGADLARWHRLRLAARVVGITGSCGKTTTKNVLVELLATRWNAVGSPNWSRSCTTGARYSRFTWCTMPVPGGTTRNP